MPKRRPDGSAVDDVAGAPSTVAQEGVPRPSDVPKDSEAFDHIDLLSPQAYQIASEQLRFFIAALLSNGGSLVVHDESLIRAEEYRLRRHPDQQRRATVFSVEHYIKYGTVDVVRGEQAPNGSLAHDVISSMRVRVYDSNDVEWLHGGRALPGANLGDRVKLWRHPDTHEWYAVRLVAGEGPAA